MRSWFIVEHILHYTKFLFYELCGGLFWPTKEHCLAIKEHAGDITDTSIKTSQGN